MAGTTSRRRPMGLTLRALWWRRGSSVTLLAVGTVTVAAAALGPMYARAAAESTLQDALRSASPADTAMKFAIVTDVSQNAVVDDVLGIAPRPGSVPGYPTTTSAIESRGIATVPPYGRVETQVVWRQDVCGHVVLVKGRCPTGPREAMVSDRSQQWGTGIRLGGPMSFPGLTVDRIDPATGRPGFEPVEVTVVGLYRPRSTQDPYWVGRGYFDAHLFSGRGDGPDTIDAVFVDRSLWPTISRPTSAEVDVDYLLHDVRLADEKRVQAGVAAAYARYPAGGDAEFATHVTQVLEAADADRALLLSSTLLVTVQLALLAWLVLFQVMGDAAEAHGNEIALAKLRGLRPRSTLAFGLGEPLAILVASVPLGIVGAWLVVAAMARTALVPGIPVVVTWGAVLGALVGFAGGVVAAALAARRVLTRPVLDQWRRVPEQHRRGAASLVLDLVLVAAAVAGLVALRNAQAEHQPRAIALLGPGLLVLTVARLGVRILPFVGRATLDPTRASPRIGAFLAVRQVLRRPAGLRLAALLAVAVGLAVFAVDAESAAQVNRSRRAALEVGAPTVVGAQFQLGHDPVSAAHKADPDGTWAMPAATWLGERRSARGLDGRSRLAAPRRGRQLAGRLGSGR